MKLNMSIKNGFWIEVRKKYLVFSVGKKVLNGFFRGQGLRRRVHFMQIGGRNRNPQRQRWIAAS